jgi:hypothetical protein
MYVCFILLLFMMAVLTSVYNKYNSTCREYFVMNQESVGRSEQELLDILTKKKQEVTKVLCQIQYYLESSIGFNQMSELSKDAKDELYSLNRSKKDKNNSVGGKFDYENKTVFGEIVISEKNEFCEIPKWNHELIVDKDAMIVYIQQLVKEYNEHVLILNTSKVDLSTYLTNFKRLLNENLDNKLLAQCDRCTGDECKKLCDNKDKTIIVKLKENQLLIDDKKKTLDALMCNYVKKYRYVEDVRNSIVYYVNELNTIWSTNDINHTKVRLNYAKNDSVVVETETETDE